MSTVVIFLVDDVFVGFLMLAFVRVSGLVRKSTSLLASLVRGFSKTSLVKELGRAVTIGCHVPFT